MINNPSELRGIQRIADIIAEEEDYGGFKKPAKQVTKEDEEHETSSKSGLTIFGFYNYENIVFPTESKIDHPSQVVVQKPKPEEIKISKGILDFILSSLIINKHRPADKEINFITTCRT